MAYERKVNECGLFANTTHPDKSDFNALLDVECGHCGKVTNFWVNGWKKVAKSGKKYLSLSLRPKTTAASNSHSAPPAAADDDFPDWR